MAKPIYFDAKIDGNRQDRPFLIFVEGVDDAHFVDVLLADLNISTDDVGIVIVGGKDKFEKAISQAKKTHSFRQMRGLALLRDADDDFQGASGEVDRIFETHFNVKIPHGQTGIADGRKIGAYIFPGENEPGDLEKACLSTVQGTAIEVLAETFMTSAQENLDPLNQPFKRKAQVYMAGAAANLCRGVGYGFKDGLFNANHASIERVKKFLQDFLEELIEKQAA